MCLSVYWSIFAAAHMPLVEGCGSMWCEAYACAEYDAAVLLQACCAAAVQVVTAVGQFLTNRLASMMVQPEKDL